jgi:hypothetical protein
MTTEHDVSASAEAPWLAALRAACAQSTQAEVARRLAALTGGKYPSPAVINQALQGRYQGDLAHLQEAVEAVLLRTPVECPVLGEIGLDECLMNQAARFSAANPLRVALFRACRGGCPNSRMGEHA